ncbi:hypothetical protein L2D08_12435 [Domibacillus sp. PGB-M46]|uniref:hypothetical protein n=1 Tax=Domibacillus sp. PGB-M46 TaxID=2910255 RepID=UPI001F58C729|nr:hypothetical protein [Domibacillus sp. PGB-M46]MCI2255173.1 hypothetical protein [Domibacillus sp. PGB-M46]
MHHGYPKVGDSLQAFVNVCGQPSPESTNEMILFDVPGINARLTCWIDEEKNVHKLSSSIPMGPQAAVELAKRFLPMDAKPADTSLDTDSAKLNALIQTYRVDYKGKQKQAVITAEETGAFTVAIED